MAEKNFKDSQFRFTDPVRYFKSNDPYYFEVDNIPIKQLEENCLWLKDQLTQTTEQLSVASTAGVKRADIDELKPYATGSDRTIRVKPGRFSARINDISSKDPLQYMVQVLGDQLGQNKVFEFATNNNGSFGDDLNTKLQLALNKFKSNVATDALGMTGLSERAFTWPMSNEDTPVNKTGANGLTAAAVDYGGTQSVGVGAKFSPGLISQALQWAKYSNNLEDSVILSTYEYNNPSNGFAKLPKLESALIKKWRGVTRFSIVDVPSELTIEVPAFDADDFEYIDEEGDNVDVTGVTTRIDMVFLYAKPVDASGVKVVKNNSITTITKPQLGLIRGAGIKFNDEGVTDPANNFVPEAAYDAEGNPMILASPGDQNNTDMGFTSASANDIAEDVRGSFPSPDDLLNIAPLLSNKLEDGALELLGQSILPLAYIVVQDTGNALINGTQVIGVEDVIDIRPFFRTAELTYNERAGIAAATPQLSLANPAVGRAELDKNMYEMKQYVDSNTGNTTIPDSIGVKATGYVFGGYNFGPEGALWDFHTDDFNNETDTNTAAKAYVSETYYGFLPGSTNVSIPDYPDWDLATWCLLDQDITSKGLYPNDYLNTYVAASNKVAGGFDEPTIVAGSYKEIVNTNGNGPTPGVVPNRIEETLDGMVYLNDADVGNTATIKTSTHFSFIKKKIFFNRSELNINDYTVDIQFLNCVPLNSHGNRDSKNGGSHNTANFMGHWIEKGQDHFTIYIAFPGAFMSLAPTNAQTPVLDRSNQRFASFLVGVDSIIDSNPTAANDTYGYYGNPRFGRCTYPSIMWTLTGVPNSKAAFNYGKIDEINSNITLDQS